MLKKSPRRKKSSLSKRIISLMILVSTLMIAVFTFIQLMNQIHSITKVNDTKGSLSAVIIKTRMENLIEQSRNSEETHERLKEALFSLYGDKIIEEAWILDKDKQMVATTSLASHYTFNISERYMIETLLDKKTFDRWLYTFRDQENNRLDVYIPLILNGKLQYLVKSSFSLENIQEALNQVYLPVGMMILVVILINTILGFTISRSLIAPIALLNEATKEIARGKLELRVNIRTGDEIQELGETFNEMTSALNKMKEKAENANPLTKLPGNISIREEVEKRILEGRKFTVVHSDLDNFKAFNDKYGLSSGDRAIQLTADLLREAIAKHGAPDDFLGHEGGDDFVMISTPERVDTLTDYFLKRFDEEIPKLYGEEDKQRGYIIAKSRQGVICKFPIMSISLAGVSNQQRDLRSYTEITNIIPEVKEKAKSLPGSVFVLDKRKN
ncbi:MAG TPA: diguanylate cyclase [Candidatus Omnitrophota bacterium]|nr:diguanylate cyclase [Candidatus Omnitrophota bacterium]